MDGTEVQTAAQSTADTVEDDDQCMMMMIRGVGEGTREKVTGAVQPGAPRVTTDFRTVVGMARNGFRSDIGSDRRA